MAESVIAKLEPIRVKIEDYLSHPEYLVDVLNKGAEKAKKRADLTFKEVCNKVGLGIPEVIERQDAIPSKI